jgi:hypothetical protein
MGTAVKLAIGGVAGVLIGWGVSFAAPKTYASQAVLSVEGPPDAQARADLVDSLAARAWPRAALARIIEDDRLYGSGTSNKSMEDLTTQMKSQISSTPTDAGKNNFAIRFVYGDPYAAQQVVKELVRRLMAENDRGAQLGIPGAYIQQTSPPTLPSYPVDAMHWPLLGEGMVAGLIVGALLSRKSKAQPKAAAA